MLKNALKQNINRYDVYVITKKSLLITQVMQLVSQYTVLLVITSELQTEYFAIYSNSILLLSCVLSGRNSVILKILKLTIRTTLCKYFKVMLIMHDGCPFEYYKNNVRNIFKIFQDKIHCKNETAKGFDCSEIIKEAKTQLKYIHLVCC